MQTQEKLPQEVILTQSLKMAIAATFTAEPIQESLAFWMQELAMPAEIEFAAYNQVFQELLNPTSLLSRNNQGINLILVRFEDWHSENSNTQIERNVNDLVLALKTSVERSPTPHIVCLCPPSPDVLSDSNQMAFFQNMEELLQSELAGINGLYLLKTAELTNIYPVENYYDAQGMQLGHIPYTPTFFAALGSAIARKIYAIASSPHKVIVLDCDNTLWKGVVGEDGVMGIELDPARKALQEFMVAQQSEGMLICLCSKNNEEDVVAVYDRRDDMPLKREHIVSWRINWQPKSENIKALAEELQLGLDSFIFIDDNPVECAEVQANCPDVLTLLLPIDGNIEQFLHHVWAFDRVKVTKEDKQRTELYKQNLERDRLRQQAITIEDFIAGLGLEIKISDLTPDTLPRVSQLTQRTNQFNFTTIRRSESEIQNLCQSGKFECRTVEVKDRFGDYGLVGVIIFEIDSHFINVDTFLLSCRVLGRGVEHQMLARLGEIAKEKGLDRVNVSFIRTEKNKPALNFLETVGKELKQENEQGYRFEFPTQLAAAIAYNPVGGESASDLVVKSEDKIAIAPEGRKNTKSIRLGRIATELYSAETIFQQIESQLSRQRPEMQRPLVEARTPTEQKLAEIWAQLLRVEKVSIDDDFFEMGGSSLLGVSLFSQIETIFGKNLPLATLLQAPTIEKLANILDEKETLITWSPLVALQPKGNRTPLFCPHAAGGNVIIYRNLVPYLAEDQPVYGLQPRGLDGKEAPITNFEEIAEYYIQAMQTIQPEGPYYLAGLSSGGHLAMAIANKLIDRGQKVAFLAMFDTYGPGYPKLLPATSLPRYLVTRFVQIIDNHWNNLMILEPKQKVEYIKEKLNIIPQESLKIIREFYWRTGRKLPSALQKVQEANKKGLKSYVPKVYPGKLTLFRAAKQPMGCVPDPQLGWTKQVGALEIHEVPGYHAGVIREPHVQVLGQKLKVCLEKTQMEINNVEF